MTTDLKRMYDDLRETVEVFWHTYEIEDRKREFGYLDELYRLAQIGLAVEQLPRGACVYNEGLFGHSWRAGELVCYDLTIESFDGKNMDRFDTPQEALDAYLATVPQELKE